MKTALTCLLLALAAPGALGQAGALGQTGALGQADSLLLYPEGVPGALPKDRPEKVWVNANDGVELVLDVQHPRLYVHRPERPNGTAVIVCPGGGYFALAMDHEGHDAARWLAARGVTAFVLKYRLPTDELMTEKAIRPLQDLQQALRIVRGRAASWGIDPGRVGVMGFSAGGHLAATAATRFREQVGEIVDPAVSVRPDFVVLVYPALTAPHSALLPKTFTPTRLLGEDPPDSLEAMFDPVARVDPQTPPAFLVHAADDRVVDPGASLDFFLALRRHGIPAELHLYERGGHGFGFSERGDGHVQGWPGALEGWLRDRGLLP